MSLFDLICVGVGGTIGSGVFVLCGYIARNNAGPGVVFSFIIAGVSCILSAASYGELSCRIPASGSSYAYVYTALGEYFAFLAAWCLSLEYGISGAAVSRSWGDKLVTWLSHNGLFIAPGLDDANGLNVFAGVLQLLCVIILLCGVDVGKLTVNIFTVLKALVVVFMIVVGLSQFNKVNVANWTPMGWSGVMSGATSCFFGYVGYDEVCCMAAEAKDPHVNLPRAVFGTIAIVTVFYVLASLALVGMLDYTRIDTDSGFSVGFKDLHLPWAANVVAIGELVTLPLVALVSFLAQPRLLFAMSRDGLLPKLFGEIDNSGNLSKNIIVSGAVCTLIAFFVPFSFLNDMISAGILFCFNLTNTALIIIRRHNALQESCLCCRATSQVSTSILRSFCSEWWLSPCKQLLVYYHLVCFVFCVVTFSGMQGFLPVSWTAGLCAITIALLVVVTSRIYALCPENEDEHRADQYRVACVPAVPLLGIFVNYFLLAQLTVEGILLLVFYLSLSTIFYFTLEFHMGVNRDDVHWKKQLLHRKLSNAPHQDLDTAYKSRTETETFQAGAAATNGSLHSETEIRDDIELPAGRTMSFSKQRLLKTRNGSSAGYVILPNTQESMQLEK